jgi:hypothetical protein
MALAFGAAANQEGAGVTTRQVTLTSVPAGALIVAVTRSAPGTTATITDDQANTWTQLIAEVNSGDCRATQNYAIAGGTATVIITATFSASGAASLVAAYFTGNSTSGFQDGFGGDNADSVTSLSVLFDAGQGRVNANDVIVTSIAGSGSGQGFVVPAGFTIPANGSNGRAALAYKIVDNLDFLTADWTCNSNSPAGTIGAYMAAFEGGGGGTKKMLLMGCG